MSTKAIRSLTKKKRILLVDDHPVVRRGLQFMLSVEPNMAVCGEAEGAPEALQKIMAEGPDAAVVDLTLKGSSGLDLIRNLRNQCPQVRVLVFSMHDELFYAERVLRMGAHGYVTKEEGAERAVEALRTILEGRKYVSQPVANRILETVGGSSAQPSGPSIDRLSDRELEVLQMIGSGQGTRVIAERLRLSIKTVESYRENIKAKLGLSGATELTSYAYEWVHRRQAA